MIPSTRASRGFDNGCLLLTPTAHHYLPPPRYRLSTLFPVPALPLYPPFLLHFILPAGAATVEKERRTARVGTKQAMQGTRFHASFARRHLSAFHLKL